MGVHPIILIRLHHRPVIEIAHSFAGKSEPKLCVPETVNSPMLSCCSLIDFKPEQSTC